MITAQGITYQIEEGKTTACEDFSFSSGINYLNYQKKDIYDVLSFSFSSLTEGSFAVDGVSIQPSGFVGGSAKVIKLDANHLGSITLVSFYKQDDPQANYHFQKLATELKTLKSKTETAEDKKDKIALLMTVLSLNDVSYLLLNLNDPLTAENRSLWVDAFANYPGCVFILLKAFETAPAKKKDWKSILAPSYRIPMALVAFLSLFVMFYGRSQQIKGSSVGTLLIVLGWLLIAGNIVLLVLFDKKRIQAKTTRNALTSCEFWSVAFNAFGAPLALGASWLLSEKMTLLSKGLFQGSSLAMAVLMTSLLLLCPLLVGHIIFSHRESSKKEDNPIPSSETK